MPYNLCSFPFPLQRQAESGGMASRSSLRRFDSAQALELAAKDISRRVAEKACPECGRWRWVGFGPDRIVLPMPEDEMVLFSPDVWLENGFARTATLLCSDKVGQLLLDAKRRKALQKFFVQELTVGHREEDFVIHGPCSQCSGTGICYCIRKGGTSAEGCVRCAGSGKCHVCSGAGKR